MKKSLGITLVVLGSIIIAMLLFGAGLFFGRTNVFANNCTTNDFWTRATNFQGPWMMGRYNTMGRYNMMGGFSRARWCGGNNTNDQILSVDQTKQVVEAYLQNVDNSDLELGEIMIFTNHSYARIVEKSTGIGAMELLIDPSTLSVYPEYGPNMMWNQKYGHRGGFTMMGGTGMMNGYFLDPSFVSSEMNVSPEQALEFARQYLDQQFPGYTTAEEANPFYGYYTIDILKDDEPTGMLSINGYSGQVFLHSWHGTFVEMWE